MREPEPLPPPPMLETSSLQGKPLLRSQSRFSASEGVRVFKLTLLGEKVLFALLFLLPGVASADYAVFDINSIPANQPISAVTQYQMVGLGNNERWDFQVSLATSTTEFEKIFVPLCRFLGSEGGVVDLEVRLNSTSSPVVASSTVDVINSNVSSIGCTATHVNATSTVFELNNLVRAFTGDTLYFTFYNRGISGSLYFSFKMNGSNGFPAYANGVYIGLSGGKTYNWSARGTSGGLPPVFYNASSSNIVCSTFDLGCYLLQGLSVAFVPSDASVQKFADMPTLASTSPFSYLYDSINIFSDLFYPATSTSVQLTIPFQGDTLTIIDTSDLSVYLPELPLIRTLIGAFIWISAGMVVIRIPLILISGH